MTFLEFNKLFPTEEAIVDYFVKLRSPTTHKCIHCGNDKVYRKKDMNNQDIFTAINVLQSSLYFMEQYFTTHNQI